MSFYVSCASNYVLLISTYRSNHFVQVYLFCDIENIVIIFFILLFNRTHRTYTVVPYIYYIVYILMYCMHILSFEESNRMLPRER